MHKTKRKRNTVTILSLLLTLVLVIISQMIPHMLLSRESRADIGKVNRVPQDEYLASYTALARNSSETLSPSERFRIILETPAGAFVSCDDDEGFLNKTSAITLAKNTLLSFYQKDLYPYSVASTFESWYRWDASLYRCIDCTFQTYTAYVWRITLTRYDGKITHHIYMTENGTIVFLMVQTEETLPDGLSPKLGAECLIASGIPVKLEAVKTGQDIRIPYPDFEDTALSVTANRQLSTTQDSDTYSFYTFETETGYGFCFLQ